jgi:imidazolonepropionase-like amidohydrolase
MKIKSLLKYLTIFLIAGLTMFAIGGFYLYQALPGPRFAPPEQGFTLINSTIINPGKPRLFGKNINSANGLISSIKITIPNQVTSPRNYANHFVMPGLIDMHAHYDAIGDLKNLAGILFLYYGVTTIRDVGSPKNIFELKRDIFNGIRIGPRIFACGRILEGASTSMLGSFVKILKNEEAARNAVLKEAKLGADCIKVYNEIDRDQYFAILQEASNLGIPVLAHVPKSVDMTEAGAIDTQHFIGLAQPQQKVLAPNEVGGDKLIEVTQKRINDIIKISLKVNMSHTPTLIVYKNVYNVINLAEHDQTGQEFLPKYYSNIFFNHDFRRALPSEHRRAISVRDEQQHRKIFQIHLNTVKAMHQAGVKLHLGSDSTLGSTSVPGAAMHKEIEYFMDAGIGLEETLKIATVGAGKSLGLTGLGRIETGAPADLLIFREDPTTNWNNADNLVAVVASGRLYDRTLLKNYLLEYKEFHDQPIFSSVIPALLYLLADIKSLIDAATSPQ